jgi:hypothetical protein
MSERSSLAANLDFSHAAAGLARTTTAAGGAIRTAERVQRAGDFVSPVRGIRGNVRHRRNRGTSWCS